MNTPARTLHIGLVLPDRVGILRDVTGALFSLGGNLVDLRQNVMGGLFTLHALAEFPTAVDPVSVEDALRAALPDAHAAMLLVRASEEAPASSPAVPVERYVAALAGADRPGWIHRAADLFARHGANVEDWRHDCTDPARTLTIGVVTIPAACDLRALRTDLERAFAPDNISVTLVHENIFRATNEVGPISQLLNAASPRIPRNAVLPS